MFVFKNLFFCLFLFCFSLSATAQEGVHATWKTESVAKKSDNSYQVTLQGSLETGWHMYAKSTELELPGLQVTAPDPANKISDISIEPASTEIDDQVFATKLQGYTGTVKVTFTISFSGEDPGLAEVMLQYSTGKADNFIPEEYTFKINFTGNLPVEETTSSDSANRILIPSIDIKNPLTECGADSSTATGNTKDKGLLALFFLGFLGGIVALITPCVFPMIPLTVSFFTKKAVNRKAGIKNAMLYGFFILLIYVLLSVPFHFLDSLNPEILNNISTNVYLNVGFFVIFIVFAISFFGVFEITLPSAISNRADSKAGAGNILGIFFMALTLAIVSFSCTGPILGSLLAGSLSADGGAMQLTAGMGGFGLALALPFALFALFPNWLSALPKSGGWLTSVKIVLGFAELALAFKFLSNADLVMHWGILKREIFIGIWIIIGIFLSLYLWNIIRFKHDSPVKKLSSIRIVLALITTAFTLYLVPGVTNTKYSNLSLISGFPPPMYYSIYAKDNECVLGLTCSHDYEEGLKMAREQNKPILLDFTGYACVNCRKMEENVWVKPEIYNLMKDKFIVISLYVDDKKKLPLKDQFTYTTKDGIKKEIVTVGDKWATFETENFQNNAQPWYAILNTKEQLLTHPLGYASTTQLEDEYLEWLKCGVEAFYKK